MTTRAPVVTVIVPVRNRGYELRILLRALDAQSIGRDRFEVVVADDGTDDGSLEGVETADGHVRVLAGHQSNAYAARNRAVRAARAQMIAACDSDCIPEPRWLEEGLAALQDAGVVAGMIKFIVPERRTLWTLMDIDTFIDQESVVASGGALGGNVFFTRAIFDAVDGFDGTLANGGDQEFVHRCVSAGATLMFAPRAVVWHPTRSGARSFLKKAWDVNSRYAVRETREGGRPYGTRLRWWIPLVSTLRSRRRMGRSLLLDRRRLRNNGVAPTVWEDMMVLPIIYILMPYLAGLAQVAGWYEQRRQEPEARRSAA